MTRKIGVFTGSRAEFGLLVPVMRAIAAHDALDLAVIVGGSHDVGDEFPIAARVIIERDDETPASTPRAIGKGVVDLTDVLEQIAPDAFLVYGDRFEAFAAMIAATQMGVPTAHIEGGDLTQGGTLDDVVRHAMSKLAHVHFPTNAEAAERLVAMGEEPWRVHETGFPPIDLIRAGDFSAPDEVSEALSLDPARPIVLFTLHPISTSPESAALEVAACTAALDLARRDLGAQIVLTHPNGDVGSAVIVQALEEFAQNADTVLRQSLGRRLYHGVLNLCGRVGRGVCVGNSSSGLKETPAFDCPNVDVGPRQNGRLRGANVIHVDYDTQPIFDAIRQGLGDKAFRQAIKLAENPYGQGDAGPRIADILAGLKLDDPAVLQKQTLI